MGRRKSLIPIKRKPVKPAPFYQRHLFPLGEGRSLEDYIRKAKSIGVALDKVHIERLWGVDDAYYEDDYGYSLCFVGVSDTIDTSAMEAYEKKLEEYNKWYEENKSLIEEELRLRKEEVANRKKAALEKELARLKRSQKALEKKLKSSRKD